MHSSRISTASKARQLKGLLHNSNNIWSKRGTVAEVEEPKGLMVYCTILQHGFQGNTVFVAPEIYYRPRTKLREGYVFTDVCDSVHRGVPGPVGGGLVTGGAWSRGGCLVETPPEWLLLRAVRILLECILVKFNCWLFQFFYSIFRFRFRSQYFI